MIYGSLILWDGSRWMVTKAFEPVDRLQRWVVVNPL